MIKKKVLIFPAGSEIAFEILNSLKYSRFVEIYGGTSSEDHSAFVYRNLIKGFPYVDEEGFLTYLNQKINEYQIDVVYPAHDSVSVFLADHAAEIDAKVIISDKDTARICRDKRETYDFFRECDFVPVVYKDIKEVTEYPVFVKPNIGQGSVGAKRVNDETELINEVKKDSSLIIAEYLPGDEYTVDCFTDNSRKIVFAKARERKRIKCGIAVHTDSCENDERINHIAETINSKLLFRGAWFFQLRKDKCDNYKLLEISPRIPGTMGLYRNRGINFPLLTLYTFEGYDVDIIDNGYSISLDRAFYSAYKLDIDYDWIYIDFDDTITFDGGVNSDVIRFLYQSKNKRKKIVLLSKHKGDIFEDMKKLCISPDLFEEVIVLDEADEKNRYIKELKAIFIDDSFSERKKVKDSVGIPVFGIDMIESLIDWKV